MTRLLHRPAPFHLAYYELLAHMFGPGAYKEVNERTGSEIRTLPGGASLKFSLEDGRVPVCGMRKLFPKTAAAEVAWFLMGDQDVTWLQKHAPIWNKFVEDDGKTIKAAYGYRWRSHFHRDQIEATIHALARNPSDRRIYITAWDPGIDGLGQPNQKNVPCPVGFTLSLVDNVLHSSYLLRSSDVFVGLPYDMMTHAILMAVMAATIQGYRRQIQPDSPEIKLGTVHVTMAHPHLYAAHYDMAKEALEGQTAFAPPDLIKDWVAKEVMLRPDDFVKAYAAKSKAATWPEFCPRPEVIQ